MICPAWLFYFCGIFAQEERALKLLRGLTWRASRRQRLCQSRQGRDASSF